MTTMPKSGQFDSCDYTIYLLVLTVYPTLTAGHHGGAVGEVHISLIVWWAVGHCGGDLTCSVAVSARFSSSFIIAVSSHHHAWYRRSIVFTWRGGCCTM